jgi:two-component system response regulator RegA
MSETRSIGTVLIVDDDERYLRAAERSWRLLDLRIATATDLPGALQAAKLLSPELAIIDLHLESGGADAISGIDVIRELKQSHPEICIAMISCQLTVIATEAAILAGARAVFDKYSTPLEILHRFEKGDLPPPQKYLETPTLERIEYDHIQRVIRDCDGNLSEAARRLGVFRSTLHRRLKKYPPRV